MDLIILISLENGSILLNDVQVGLGTSYLGTPHYIRTLGCFSRLSLNRTTSTCVSRRPILVQPIAGEKP